MENETIIKYITENINNKNNDGETCLIIMNRNNLISEKLSNNDFLDIEELLITKRLDINITDNKGNTALIYAILNKNINYKIDNISILINKYTDLNKYNEEGKTPLIYAIQNNIDYDIINLLINSGADVNKEDKDGKTPLIYAIEKNISDSIIKLLIDSGADVNKGDNDGNTPLIYAIEKNIRDRIIKLLIDSGADINIRNKKGMTPLFYLINKYYKDPSNNTHSINYENDFYKKELIELLIDKRADVNKDKEVLFYCIEKRINNKIIEILLNKVKNINMVDNDDKTLLFYCIEYDNEYISELLINKGADINKRDKDGKTPLFYCIEYGNEYISELLINKGVVRKIEDKDIEILIFYAIDLIYKKEHNYKLYNIYKLLLNTINTTEMYKKVLIYQINIYIDTHKYILKNKKNYSNINSIYFNIRNECIEFIGHLLKKKKLINFVDNDNNTLLTYIIKNCNIEDISELYPLIKLLIDKGVDLFIEDKYSKTFLIYLFDDIYKKYKCDDTKIITQIITQINPILLIKEKDILDKMILSNTCKGNCYFNNMNNLKYLYIEIYKRMYNYKNKNKNINNNNNNNKSDIGLEYIYINNDEKKYTKSFFIKIQNILNNNNNNKEFLKNSFILRLQEIKSKILSKPILRKTQKILEPFRIKFFKTTSSNKQINRTNYDKLLKTDINKIILDHLILSKRYGYPIYYDDNEFKNIFFDNVIDYLNEDRNKYSDSDNREKCTEKYKELLKNISNIKRKNIKNNIKEKNFISTIYDNYLDFYLSHFVKDDTL